MPAVTLKHAARSYQSQSYAGPVPRWPQPRAKGARPLLALAAAGALLALAGAPFVATDTGFGQHYQPRPSPYAALKNARSAAPTGPSSRPPITLVTRLPPQPRRRTGFGLPAEAGSTHRPASAPVDAPAEAFVAPPASFPIS